jgi:hypothetical protein
MTIDELAEWVDTCPTHKWEVITMTRDFVTVTFPIEEDEDDES